jgi:hypothetical protein
LWPGEGAASLTEQTADVRLNKDFLTSGRLDDKNSQGVNEAGIVAGFRPPWEAGKFFKVTTELRRTTTCKLPAWRQRLRGLPLTLDY